MIDVGWFLLGYNASDSDSDDLKNDEKWRQMYFPIQFKDEHVKNDDLNFLDRVFKFYLNFFLVYQTYKFAIVFTVYSRKIKYCTTCTFQPQKLQSPVGRRPM